MSFVGNTTMDAEMAGTAFSPVFIPHHRQKCEVCGRRAGEHPGRTGAIEGVCTGFRGVRAHKLPGAFKLRTGAEGCAKGYDIKSRYPAVMVNAFYGKSAVADAADRKLKSIDPETATFASDAEALARVLIKHHGDDAARVLTMAAEIARKEVER